MRERPVSTKEIKLEQGDWGSLVFSRHVWKYCDPSRWEMITQRREDWWGMDNAYLHPDSPLIKIDDCCQNPDQIVCPYCGDKHDPEGRDYECEEFECYGCERAFDVEVSFGYGFSTTPKPCKHHHWVFEAQYAYKSDGQWTTWRNMVCINCGHDNNSKWPMGKFEQIDGKWQTTISNQPLFTLLPWLDEYNDPDFFDPEGVLKTGASLTEDYETPILDFLRNRSQSWCSRWTHHPDNKPGISTHAQRAIKAYEQVYGDL